MPQAGQRQYQLGFFAMNKILLWTMIDHVSLIERQIILQYNLRSNFETIRMTSKINFTTNDWITPSIQGSFWLL